MYVSPVNNIYPTYSKYNVSQINFTGIPKVKSPVGEVVVRTLDIGSYEGFPAGVLSNFTESHFVLDGKKIYSMEGFLQSLKTSDISEQEITCQLIGYNAKKVGHKYKKRKGYNPEVVYWNGKEYGRDSVDYRRLLKRAYAAKYKSDSTFRQALNATKGQVLQHSIGKNSILETILTEKEFVEILTELRDRNYINKFIVFMNNLFGRIISSFQI